MKGITVTNTVGTAVLDQFGNKSDAELNTNDNIMIAPIITKIATSILPVIAEDPFLPSFIVFCILYLENFVSPKTSSTTSSITTNGNTTITTLGRELPVSPIWSPVALNTASLPAAVQLGNKSFEDVKINPSTIIAAIIANIPISTLFVIDARPCLLSLWVLILESPYFGVVGYVYKVSVFH